MRREPKVNDRVMVYRPKGSIPYYWMLVRRLGERIFATAPRSLAFKRMRFRIQNDVLWGVYMCLICVSPLKTGAKGWKNIRKVFAWVPNTPNLGS